MPVSCCPVSKCSTGPDILIFWGWKPVCDTPGTPRFSWSKSLSDPCTALTVLLWALSHLPYSLSFALCSLAPQFSHFSPIQHAVLQLVLESSSCPVNLPSEHFLLHEAFLIKEKEIPLIFSPNSNALDFNFYAVLLPSFLNFSKTVVAVRVHHLFLSMSSVVGCKDKEGVCLTCAVQAHTTVNMWAVNSIPSLCYQNYTCLKSCF